MPRTLRLVFIVCISRRFVAIVANVILRSVIVVNKYHSQSTYIPSLLIHVRA